MKGKPTHGFDGPNLTGSDPPPQRLLDIALLPEYDSLRTHLRPRPGGAPYPHGPAWNSIRYPALPRTAKVLLDSG